MLKVAMKGGSFIFAVKVPEMAPLKAPVAIAATTPVHIGNPQLVKTTPQMTAQKVISVPTERSMPPVMITKVLAIASTPLTAVACKMPNMFSVCMKAGERKLKTTSMTMRLAKANNFCSASGAERRAHRLETRPSLASVATSDRIVIGF